MNKIFVFFAIIFVLLSASLYAQENAIANAINSNNKVSILENKEDKKNYKLWRGWSVGLNYGITKFQGDIAQYDHYPAYQETGNFSELKTAVSLSIEKKVNSFYSLATEFSSGSFAGLRRANEYSGYEVYDVSNSYEGNGDKFVASFSEVDLLVNVNLTNAMSYFGKSKTGRKIYFNGKFGIGYNVFNSLRTNLFSDTYIYSYGYLDGNDNISVSDYGTQKKSFSNQTKESVYIYGIRANYKLSPKIELNLDYTIRNALNDKWDASIMATQYKSDNFAFLSIGVSYNIGNHDFNNDWINPIDGLKDDVTTLFVKIDGFTDDSDNDGVADAFDKSPNTPIGVAVDCCGRAFDVDMDNVPDYIDSDSFSNRGVLVDANGVELDDDKDGVPNSKDLESKSHIGTMVNQFGMNVGSASSFRGGGMLYFPSIYFNSGSAVVGSSNDNRIATMALLLKNNQHINLNVVGHTDYVGDPKFNQELGLKRANAVINYLVSNYSIDADRLHAITKGEEDPLLNITTINNGLEGNVGINILAEINRRVDFEIAY